MSIYYNNNNNNYNNGMYNNRNRIYSQGGQNMNPNSNYNRSQPNYPNNNNNYNNSPNYNQNYNYQQQQQNRNNQNQQNNGPQPFITVKMGRLLISSATLEEFSKSLKSVEWTTNKSYLQANNIDVKMKQGLQGQISNDISVPKNRFNEYSINFNFDYSSFSNFIKEVINNNNNQKEQQKKEKISFIRNNFPFERNDIDTKDLYLKIGQNRKDVVMKDSSLYRKVERLLPLIKPLDVQNNYKKEEDKKMLSNNNDFSLFNNNDNDNKNNNDDKKIYTNTPGY